MKKVASLFTTKEGVPSLTQLVAKKDETGDDPFKTFDYEKLLEECIKDPNDNFQPQTHEHVFVCLESEVAFKDKVQVPLVIVWETDTAISFWATDKQVDDYVRSILSENDNSVKCFIPSKYPVAFLEETRVKLWQKRLHIDDLHSENPF